MGEPVEKIEVGDLVRSYDFRGNDDCYVEGVVTDIAHVNGQERYEIKVSRKVFDGMEDNDSEWVGSLVYPPVNGLPMTSGGVTNFVKKI